MALIAPPPISPLKAVLLNAFTASEKSTASKKMAFNLSNGNKKTKSTMSTWSTKSTQDVLAKNTTVDCR